MPAALTRPSLRCLYYVALPQAATTSSAGRYRRRRPCHCGRGVPVEQCATAADVRDKADDASPIAWGVVGCNSWIIVGQTVRGLKAGINPYQHDHECMNCDLSGSRCLRDVTLAYVYHYDNTRADLTGSTTSYERFIESYTPSRVGPGSLTLSAASHFGMCTGQ